jgi:hypothetical protein
MNGRGCVPSNEKINRRININDEFGRDVGGIVWTTILDFNN